MKRGTPDHPKLLELQAALDCSQALAVGLLELLWHWTARYAPAGDVGRWSDAMVARGAGWDGDGTSFVRALVDTGWVDEHAEHRLVVHDWPEHADDGVHVHLARAGRFFANGTKPSMTRLSQAERKRLDESFYRPEIPRSARRAHAVRSESAPPLPLPRLSPALAPPEPLPPQEGGVGGQPEDPSSTSERHATAASDAQPEPRPVTTPANAPAAAFPGSLRDRLFDVWPHHRRGLPAEVDEILAELPDDDRLVLAARRAVANPDWQQGRRAYGLPRWLRGRGWIAALAGADDNPSGPIDSPTWRRIVDALEGRMHPDEHAAWISPLVPIRETGDELVVAAPSARFVHTVEERFRQLLDTAGGAIAGELLQIVVVDHPTESARATA